MNRFLISVSLILASVFCLLTALHAFDGAVFEQMSLFQKGMFAAGFMGAPLCALLSIRTVLGAR